MKTLWIVAANRSYAKIFEAKGMGRSVKEVHHLDNPDGRKKAGEIFSDRPGRAFDRMGEGRHALGTEVDFHEQEQKAFASRIARLLEEGKEKKAYEDLAFVAPPHFLGELNQAISNQVKKSLTKEIHKDLPAHLSEHERIDQICKYLDLWNQTTLSS
jgi:protein required for attachment to host cells